MTLVQNSRAKLLLGSGAIALAACLAALPNSAQAQAFRANPTVVSGSATFDRAIDGLETIEVTSPTVVIDWTPLEDPFGNAFDFLPDSHVATFQDAPAQGGFAALNRILPSTNNNVVVMNGTVLSRLQDAAGGLTPGGTVAFYSPNGIMVGSNAVFDVGSLLLTTLDPDLTSFNNFASAGGTLNLIGNTATTALISIAPGAQINATAENSFFAVAAAEIQMQGNARINGSHAYVAGEIVNLTYTNGLFDIQVPLGTTANTAINLNGNIGGPSSTGAGDNHMIYAVARANTNPINMLFSGNLGFDPAVSAGVVNGEIILAANHDVFGRTVDGGSISDGINATFDGASAGNDQPADIFVDNFTATSSLLAITNGIARVEAFNGPSSVDGNLLVVGREEAQIVAENGHLFTIAGDALVSSRAFGVLGTLLNDPNSINAEGGLAIVEALNGAEIDIGGGALVTADALAGAETGLLQAGTATGGEASVSATGGTVRISGNTTVSAQALGTTQTGILLGADIRGGQADVQASAGGDITLNGSLTTSAAAIATDSDLINPSTGSNAFGGNTIVAVDGNSFINVEGTLDMSADASAGSSSEVGKSATADAGDASVSVTGPGGILIGDVATLTANAIGADNDSGTGLGGDALGGVAGAIVTGGGSITFLSDYSASATAQAGDGNGGGIGVGGISGALADQGIIDIQGSASADSSGTGGDADLSIGGMGGDGFGGTAIFQAVAGQGAPATILIATDASLIADGIGGRGGLGDGAAIAPGTGGTGTGGLSSAPNQADPTINNGVYLRADGDNGTISVGGASSLSARGVGGLGGDGLTGQDGGNGGDALGGDISIGLTLLGGTGGVGNGSATFADIDADASAQGGAGGLDGNTLDRGGIGGFGQAGQVVLNALYGTVAAAAVQFTARGSGGQGGIGGNGTGAIRAGAQTGQGGSLIVDSFSVDALGIGGTGRVARGGDGTGGLAFMDFSGGTTNVNGDVELLARGSAGGSLGGDGGNATGGTAQMGFSTADIGNATISGNAIVDAIGLGSGVNTGGTAGDALGGMASVAVQAGSTLTIGSLQVNASGIGGLTNNGTGGNGTGGTASITSDGAGSMLTILRNVPNAVSSILNNGSIASANGFGSQSNGGGSAGNGTGGTVNISATNMGSIAFPADPGADPTTRSVIQIQAQGQGGNAGGDGVIAGNGTGGAINLILDDGAFSSGQIGLSTNGGGGSATNGADDTTGGDATGGDIIVSLLNGAVLTVQDLSVQSQGFARNGSGIGNGGNGTGGTNRFSMADSTLNLTGQLVINSSGTGGAGQIGGDGNGNDSDFVATNSTIAITPNANGGFGIVMSSAGAGVSGNVQGGDGTAGSVTMSLTQTDITGGSIRMIANGRGGDALDVGGAAGEGVGGTATLTVVGSNLGLAGRNDVEATGTGGRAQNGTNIGGAAQGGTATVSLTDSAIAVTDSGTVIGSFDVRSLASGGIATTRGDSTAGNANLQVLNSSISAPELVVEARANSTASTANDIGGNASAGSASVNIQGDSLIDASTMQIVADAFTSAGGSAFAGGATLNVGGTGNEQANIGLLDISGTGSGANPADLANSAGQFVINITGGEVNVANLEAEAGGDVVNDNFGPSTIIADGGSLLISLTGTIASTNVLAIRTGNGGIIGDPTFNNSTTSISVTAQNSLEIQGDDDGTPGFGAAALNLIARNITIENGARVSAIDANITSLDTDNLMVLGGTSDGPGFTLTQEEFDRLDIVNLFINAPELTGAGANDPDIVIRDLMATGSGAGTLSNLSILAAPLSGIIRVEGDLTFANASGQDTLTLRAGDRLEVVTPGRIAVLDANGAPIGSLSLNANNIWVADDATITQLQGDVGFAGRDDQLATAATGSDDPLGYIQAGGVTIDVGESLLVRNTGTTTEQGGILVGASGLSILSTATGAPQLDVFAYGRRQGAQGNFITGEDFFNEVEFNTGGQIQTTYDDAAEFNDCVINTATCPVVTTPVTPTPNPPPDPTVIPVPPVTNPTVIAASVSSTEPLAQVESQSDEEFGIDFPGLVEAPLLSEEPELDDPVTSGGETSQFTSAPAAGGN